MSAFSDSSYSASSYSTDSYSFFDIITALTGAEIIRFRDSETAVFNFAVVSNIETLFSDRVSETTVEGAETSDVSHSCNFSAYDTSVSGFN
jgi:hypothetical protein